MEPHNGFSSEGYYGVPDTPSLVGTPPAAGQGQRPILVPMRANGKKRVGFSSDTTPPSDVEQRHFGASVQSPVETATAGPSTIKTESPAGTGDDTISHEELSKELHKAFGAPYVPKPVPTKAAIRNRGQPTEIEMIEMPDVELDGEAGQRHISGLQAHQRAQQLAAKVGSYQASRSPSRASSVDLSTEIDVLNPQRPKVGFGGETKSGDDSDEDALYQKRHEREPSRSSHFAQDEASRLVRSYTQRQPGPYENGESPLHSGQITPVTDRNDAEFYVAPPSKYRGGVLASLLKLSGAAHGKDGTHSPTWSLGRGHPASRSVDDISLAGLTPVHTPGHSPTQSGTSTPTGRHRRSRIHWPHSRHGSESPSSIATLIGSSATLAHPNKDFGEETKKHLNARPGPGKRSRSTEAVSSALHKFTKKRADEEIRITKHIAETIARHKYIVKLCRALMDYGAPTHRLEEYLKMSSRVLDIEAQFLYIPGCMLISFDDPATHTTEVKLVRTPQGVDLGKLRDTHQIYKQVVHDQIDVKDATELLDEVMIRSKKFPVWFRVLIYGLAAVSVGPFAFGARFIDLPIAFVLGCIVGWLQLVVSPKSDLYANVFEIVAAIVTSFLGRAFGSITYPGSDERVFCFSALAQSSIALILPGYTVLCASLELQSRSIVAGSVRMVYAIIYSLFLGYGITIGTVLFGWMDKNATSATTCVAPMSDSGYWFFFFVPIFTICLIIVNQAKWKQAPVMLVIAFAGYLVNYFSAKRFVGNAQVTQTLGAFTIGVMANLYARLGPACENSCMKLFVKVRPYLQTKKQKLRDSANSMLSKQSSAESGLFAAEKSKSWMKCTWRESKGYGMAAAAMLPAIFVQVPSGLSVSGSLVAGITSADQIVNNSTGTTTASSGTDTSSINSASFTVSLSVIQIAIGITVGLFLSAVAVYPLGKKRSGLFSF